MVFRFSIMVEFHLLHHSLSRPPIVPNPEERVRRRRQRCFALQSYIKSTTIGQKAQRKNAVRMLNNAKHHK